MHCGFVNKFLCDLKRILASLTEVRVLDTVGKCIAEDYQVEADGDNSVKRLVPDLLVPFGDVRVDL